MLDRSPTGARRVPRRAVHVALAALLAAAPPLRAQSPTGTVAGHVTGEDGAAIAGATITATVSATGVQVGTLTRGDGGYRLTLRPGTYELRTRLIGYTGRRDTVSVTDGGTVTRDYRLVRAASALEAVAVVGSRTEARTVIESPVPIDVLSTAELRSTGRTETAQVLQQLAPSVNFPRPSVTDGTDHIRPATLRGLGADQTLVLVNGKRRHTSALLNVNGSVGRGQAAVDLNAIPASMIERIEVLRDGAAAQYGSDAIAGVVNIVLKSSAPAELSTTLGRTQTTYGGQTVTGQASATAAPVAVETPTRTANDGRVMQVAGNAGLRNVSNGFLHAGLEYRDRNPTNRTLGDPRPQSFTDVSGNVSYSNATGPINHRQGDAATTDVVGFLNAQRTFARGLELYAFGGVGHRDGEGAGFFRRSQDDRTIRSLHPEGFLPLIQSDIWDGSGFAGGRGTLAGWNWDLSTGYGRNSFRYEVTNSNNASMGAASPTDFYVGTLQFGQWTNNLDFTREFTLGSRVTPLRVAAGAEFRLEQYKIEAGDPASYIDGQVPVLDANGQPTTRRAAAGAQVFPGFRPSDATDESRHNVGVYLDVESDITKSFLVGGAVRFEDYSDFGSATSVKLASRLTIVPRVVLRGAVNTGFRAPSLQQSFYSATSTNFITINGALTPVEVKQAPVNSPVAIALGAQPLKPEKSLNYSGGVALQPTRSLALTVDLYRIHIDDRIVLSENFVQTTQVLELLRPFGAAAARYTTNAIDTRTNGIDIVANYGLDLRSNGFVRLTGGYNNTLTRATQVVPNPTQLGNQNEVLFGRVERSRIEEGQPRDNILASATYDRRGFSAVARTQRFGKVTTRSTVGSEYLDQTFGAKWVTDVSGSYRFLNRFTVTVGADNVFDVYPDQNNVPGSATVSGNSNFGIFPYTGFSPFGFNGRFVYTRLALGF